MVAPSAGLYIAERMSALRCESIAQLPVCTHNREVVAACDVIRDCDAHEGSHVRSRRRRGWSAEVSRLRRLTTTTAPAARVLESQRPP